MLLNKIEKVQDYKYQVEECKEQGDIEQLEKCSDGEFTFDSVFA